MRMFKTALFHLPKPFENVSLGSYMGYNFLFFKVMSKKKKKKRNALCSHRPVPYHPENPETCPFSFYTFSMPVVFCYISLLNSGCKHALPLH